MAVAVVAIFIVAARALRDAPDDIDHYLTDTPDKEPR
jgi:hypothetical protein